MSADALIAAALGTGGITTLILGLRAARREDHGAAVEQAGKAVATMSTLIDELESALSRAREDRDRYLAALQAKNLEIGKLEVELEDYRKGRADDE